MEEEGIVTKYKGACNHLAFSNYLLITYYILEYTFETQMDVTYI